ncbi:restriction endonuclease subunit S [Methanolobus halotolerans]|uniref:Restriction endonuclease subunit S n=1 Tax=Methanolobus halotolerans TaxID=2052935 RepID=A0A4E0PVR5_9EURY|nr:restriction endonuclease subunit S [Methanolobus halotolerans]TGC09448.1 restriction endonuclease subunit S [Methanolobus halotolerans]
MNAETFFENFSLLSESPNGIQKLREMILQMAIQGKLVPQNPEDEPAQILLKRIKAEKERLVDKKQIRKTKALPPVKINKFLFDIPETWEWVRLGEIGDWGAGATPNRKKSEYYDGSINWFKSGELNNRYITESDEQINELALKECSLRLNKPEDVLIAMYGATIGKVAILKSTATTNQAVCACTCFDGFFNEYLFLILKAYRKHFTNQGAGGAQPNISRVKIIHTLAPLPPLEEQKRIVIKVDQLMELCDQLESLQQTKYQSRIQLNNSALSNMLDAGSPEEFAEQWMLVCDNFDLLYDNLDNVEKLKQVILQLAVQGKLVPQDPNDEPAYVLLEKIKGKNPSLLIVDGEMPYSVPETWAWFKLGDVGRIVGGGTPKTSNDEYFCDDGIHWLTPADLYNYKQKYVSKGRRDITELGLKNSSAQLMPAGTVLFSSRAPIGYVAIAQNDICTNQGFKSCVPHKMEMNEYIYYFLKFAVEEIENAASGTTFKEISGKAFGQILIPLPPLEEQMRIVAKVDQLMALCGELETRIKKAQDNSEKLTTAMVSSVVG